MAPRAASGRARKIHWWVADLEVSAARGVDSALRNVPVRFNRVGDWE
jgi:hypothetical protein